MKQTLCLFRTFPRLESESERALKRAIPTYFIASQNSLLIRERWYAVPKGFKLKFYIKDFVIFMTKSQLRLKYQSIRQNVSNKSEQNHLIFQQIITNHQIKNIPT
jgi:hypothetical protein